MIDAFLKTPKAEAVEIKADQERTARGRPIIRNVFQAVEADVVFPAPTAMNCAGRGLSTGAIAGTWRPAS
jgi:hypothetical protein